MEVLAKHPFLAEYEDLWPIDDFTRATLKIHITTCKIAEDRKKVQEYRDEVAALRAEEDENGDGHEVLWDLSRHLFSLSGGGIPFISVYEVIDLGDDRIGCTSWSITNLTPLTFETLPPEYDPSPENPDPPVLNFGIPCSQDSLIKYAIWAGVDVLLPQNRNAINPFAMYDAVRVLRETCVYDKLYLAFLAVTTSKCHAIVAVCSSKNHKTGRLVSEDEKNVFDVVKDELKMDQSIQPGWYFDGWDHIVARERKAVFQKTRDGNPASFQGITFCALDPPRVFYGVYRAVLSSPHVIILIHHTDRLSRKHRIRHDEEDPQDPFATLSPTAMLKAIGLWLLQLVFRRAVPTPRSDERSSPGLTINLWLFPFFFFMSTHCSDPALERNDRREESPGFIVPIPPNPRSRPPRDRSMEYDRSNAGSTSGSALEISEIPNTSSTTSAHVPATYFDRTYPSASAARQNISQSAYSNLDSDHNASGSYHAMETRSRQPHSDPTHTGLIPKPDGPAGSPNGGGYTLRVAMGLSLNKYRQVYDFVKSVVRRDMKYVSLKQQPPQTLQKVLKSVTDAYPYLHNYEDLWPVNELIRVNLKTLCAAKRKAEDRNRARAVGVDENQESGWSSG
ncbi:hypothetical protein EUX98_g8772 [Antrodiella citrinella]|uniref:Uncharacterized protein n=1 Tax=Antrodiella citrinella TaxID=2447956 RepID=A0A4S4M320_9APHY|nr:hypothetical protein EUX98_g8772 [Antrodiella citrinella]